MKIILSIFILISVFTAFGQKANKPVPKTPEAKPSEEIKKNNDDAFLLVMRLSSAKSELYFCYDKLFNNSASPEDTVTCVNKAKENINNAYTKISQSPNAIKLLMADEIAERTQDSIVKLREPKTEQLLSSPPELQRIIILQNQRIIELLEELVKKK